MAKLQPKLFYTIRHYSKEQCIKDIIAGIIVAIIALPLSIALAIASGVGPENGIYTAIIAGFLISFLGGSRVQIAGPTAAFASIVAGIVATNGMGGLATATILAGIILVIMGVCKLGNLISFIPQTITTGFTTGIAVTIAVGQIKDFFGLTYPQGTVTIETIEKAEAVVHNISTFNITAFLIGALALVILILGGKFMKKVPASLIAVIVTAAVVKIFDLNVNTIGSVYTNLQAGLPNFVAPDLSLEMIKTVFPDAVTIAILAGIESLLSCVVADGMIGSKHNSNMELVAQGIGNTASALFGGIPATGAIARTAANIKNGGRTPVAGMVHAIVLLLVLVSLMPLAKMIPMPTIAAILFMVAYNMSEIKKFATICKISPKSDIFVLVITFVLTVIFDLVVAIAVGIVLACILFMKRMADETHVTGWKYVDDEKSDAEHIELKQVPKNTLVYEISGPMFFGASNKLLKILLDIDGKNTVILRMGSVPALDATALSSLQDIHAKMRKKNVTLILSHVNEQPMSVLQKSGFDEKVGIENICAN
ncbi:MAG: STAS domain-containing protein, partial [Oscillospiraceae bacterium]|nr:STAS domain-containing protein [Oscillospiraceae bacterium]